MNMADAIKTKKSDDLVGWYNNVVLNSGMMDFSAVKGFPVYKPYGYSIWEDIEAYLDKRFKEIGVKNAYFPLLIPESILSKESEHIKGFAPEVAWVTKGGDKDLDEKLAIRPTSETIMYDSYSRWVQSYRDLPLLINQWNTVVRWETKETRLLLRGREILWQEGHCAFETDTEAENNALSILGIYKEFMEKVLAVPVFEGKKSESEKFSGAVTTYTIETIIPNNFMIQSATSHYLGQNFSKPFDIKFVDRSNQWKYVYQTSWGISMRAMAAMVMVHGDDNGLVLPPAVAPIQVVVIPIIKDESGKEKILSYSKEVAEKLRKMELRVYLDDRDDQSPGWKFHQYDLIGVPVRLDVGEREEKSRTVSAKFRFDGSKDTISEKNLIDIADRLADVQKAMLEKAKEAISKQIAETIDKKEFIRLLKKDEKVVKAAWCGEPACEGKIHEETGATSRCIPLAKEKLISESCIYCGMPAKFNAFFSHTY